MAFLDNSGDILLDAVLTDTGRMRLAKGDGTFRIVKFALGDDEINYELYNLGHASGSAYYDLDILQTPILEAFTNNTSMMQSKLMSIPRTNLLYLPIIKLVQAEDTIMSSVTTLAGPTSKYIIAVDEKTAQTHTADAPGPGISGIDASEAFKGIVNGSGKAIDSGVSPSYIMLHQGLDTTEISETFGLSADLIETQYIVQMDNRLGRLVTAPQDTYPGNGQTYGSTTITAAKVSFIDDDNIATYYLSKNTDSSFVYDLTGHKSDDTFTVSGPRGSALVFSVQAQLQVQQSNYLFEKLGQTSIATLTHAGGSTFTGNYIDSTIRVIGATTGYKIDVPIRYVKRTS